MSGLIIAIDGPSASGKSTVSQAVARRLGFIHVDSGSLYRGVTWFFLNHDVNLNDSARVASTLKQISMDFKVSDNSIRFSINGVYPDAGLRARAVDDNVSQAAALPAVREWIVDKLRKISTFGNLVMEGRDIGTAVFPEATYMYYLDASPEERARRRFNEAPALMTYDEVLRSILKRDGIDSSRSTAPLKVAPGAIVIQSTKMTVAEVTDMIVNNITCRKP
jgi:cytidylate kinase